MTKKPTTTVYVIFILFSMTLAACTTIESTPLTRLPQAGTNESQDVLSRSTAEANFDIFIPVPSGSNSRVDYSLWDDALRSIVFYMGESIRLRKPKPIPETGTRVIYGHDSAYRLEGNRIRFSEFDDEMVEVLMLYRQDLETVPSQINITKLPRNEQLAYWINLHNVAVIEQIARGYPVTRPSTLQIDGGSVTLDDAKFLTVSELPLSLKDIRTKIVYPNWTDPSVIYGFFRGDIGGPSIQGQAFTRQNITTQLNTSGEEFVNSLRGVQSTKTSVRVSKIYQEARPFYFKNWPNDLQNHLREYAQDKVQTILANGKPIKADFYEYDIADLAGGEKYISARAVLTTDKSGRTIINGSVSGPPASVRRLMREFREKIEIQRKRNGGKRGTVIIIDVPTEDNKVEIK